ncbi:hypothetical protein [Bradyrhizobium sp. SRS-191]|uniref:hypothetical protein n=1 Tax=Bradyrhizobium sp. SRS-191 TaxID=2962606 RepID=UPI00211E5534|nr:hypothetical protein [Bradyrhizobium sp. SRS-191]
MTSSKIVATALLLSAMAAGPASAQGWFWGQQEPAAFQAMYPNRDVLNGGALTPAGRLGLVRAQGAAPVAPTPVDPPADDRPPHRR